jgi:hypothetical protein
LHLDLLADLHVTLMLLVVGKEHLLFAHPALLLEWCVPVRSVVS